MPEKQRDNYFILLGIDPKESWSNEKFDQTLIQKRAEWSKKSKLPGKRGAQYREYLALIPEIKEIMGDPAKRAEEAQRAKNTKQETPEKVEQEKLIKEIDLISSKGFIEESEIQKLVIKYKKYVPESFIRTEINRKNIKINQTTQDFDESSLETLQERDLKRIKGYLDTLGYQNIYDFLELSKTTSDNNTFIEKASEKYKESQKSGLKNTKTEAITGLHVEVKNIFKTEKTRRRYDNSLELEQYKIIKESVKAIAQNSSNKILYAKQFAEILKEAQSSGIKDIEKAQQVISKYAKDVGLSPEVIDIEVFKQKISCPQCNTINDRSQEKCSNCGCSLRIQCPSCNLVSAITDKACSQCSFPIGNEPNVRNYLKEARKLIDDKLYDEGLTYLNFARQEWSTIPPRPLNDDLSKAIANYFREIEQIKQKQITLEKQLQNAIDDSRYYEARSLVKQIQNEASSTNTTNEQKLIEAKIKQAETELLKAREIERQGKDPIGAYQNVLWICKDCKQAKDALAKTPPLAPSGLRARRGNKIVSLTWNQSDSKNVSYTIVRKYASRPISSSDGEKLATVSSTTYDDTKIQVGIPIYYGVYTNREGVLSTTAANLKTPVFLIGEVSNAVAQAKNQEAHISWQPPDNVSVIQIYRSTKPLDNPKQGKSLEVIGKSQLADRNLENGQKYYYTIYSVFQDYNGNLVTSSGVTVEAIPVDPPKPIDKLTIEVISTSPTRKLKLSWEPSNKGDGVILESDRHPDFYSNILPQGALSEYGKILEGNKQSVTTTIQTTGIVYFTPVLLFQKTAYLGKTVEYVNVDDVTNLKVQKQKKLLQLYWDWPQNCKKAVITYSYDDFPVSDRDSGATSIDITKAQYELRGHYPLKTSVEKDHFIVVRTVLEQDGKSFVASGLSKSARARVSLSSNITIQYKIGRKRKLFGKGELILTLKTQGTGKIPQLVLISKQGGIPIRKTHGSSVLEIPATNLSEDNMTLSFEIPGNFKQSFGKLFLVDDSFYESQGGYIRINHPASSDMELF